MPWAKFARSNWYALGESALSGYEINHKLINSGGGRGI